MSTLEDLDDLERDNKDNKKDGDDGDKDKDGKTPGQNGTGGGGDTEMKDDDKKENEDAIDSEILYSSTRDIVTRRKLLESDMRVMKSEFQRLTHEKNAMNEKLKDNVEKIENNR